jgi:hypothetical protein
MKLTEKLRFRMIVVYNSKEFLLNFYENKILLISYDKNDVAYGLKEDSKSYFLHYNLNVIPDQIESAYKLEIIAEVDGFECPIGGFDENGYFLFTRGKGADEHFKMVLGHGAPDRFYRKDEEIENIWEVRTPIEGFPFKTEKIVYLKMYGQWLDKPGCSVFPQ